MLSAPEVMVMADLGTNKLTVNAEPEIFWQEMQWHIILFRLDR
jgi:hypothetical protein